MIRRPFGWTGVEVPVVGQGTWMIESGRRAVESLRLGIDLGLTHIDTAEMYGNGRAEEVAGEAIEGRRADVFLTTKVLPSNATYDGTLRACERSLKRLRTEWIDLYLLHWKGSHPLAETLRAMEELVRRGQVRYIGVSNFDVEDVRAAQQALRNERLACDQVLYHLGDRGIERNLIPYCAEQQIAVAGYGPFGSGGFPQARSHGGRVLAEIAARRWRTPRQVALNFLMRLPGLFTIPKAAQPEHVRDNSQALEWPLEREDLEAIERAFPAPDHDVPLGMI
ncbi:MAG: aldo/keto reductase [Acidobacteria bacterium]|nr:aldo/keto reductase [Acidobacteriota bacterium]